MRATLGTLIAETRAKITYTSLPEIEADPVLIEQVLQNLIANALQYRRSGEDPEIEVSGERSGDVWLFAVNDNGHGIPRSFQERVFEPLKRLHGNESPGTGLGLTLCRTIVARHGGRIWVESDGAGCGATFRFSLSAIQNEPSGVKRSVAAAP